ncbi:MAG: hypothetical protein SNJ71_07730, partial [Bacteroidales bacterium]
MFFYIVIINVFSQNFISKDKSWNVVHFTETPKTISYKIYGDTVINNIPYSCLYYSYGEDFNFLYKEIAGFLYEVCGRIYIRFADGSTFLLYDFNVKLCDTLYLFSYETISLIRLQVEFVDSINIGKKNHRIIYFNSLDKNTYYNQYWIEGIGSSLGVIEHCLNQ